MKKYKLSNVILLIVVILLTILAMRIYYEYKYDLIFSDKFCKSKGYESFGGVEYNNILESNELVVAGIKCVDKEGVYHGVGAS